MILGKRFSRFKRKYNAGSAIVSFTKKDGTEIRPHRKLNMLIILFMIGGVNKKKMVKEFIKFGNKHGLTVNV